MSQTKKEEIQEDKIPWTTCLFQVRDGIKLRQLEEFLRIQPSEKYGPKFRAKYDEKYPDQPIHHEFMGYSHEAKFLEYNIIHKALHKTFEQIRDMRYEKISSHHESHAKSFAFYKVLDLLEGNVLGLGDHEDNPVCNVFNSIFKGRLIELKDEYQPIHDVLTASVSFNEKNAKIDLTIREKNLLFRAFWDDFSKVWSRFSNIDWGKEYCILWEIALKLFENTQEEEHE